MGSCTEAAEPGSGVQSFRDQWQGQDLGHEHKWRIVLVVFGKRTWWYQDGVEGSKAAVPSLGAHSSMNSGQLCQLWSAIVQTMGVLGIECDRFLPAV